LSRARASSSYRTKQSMISGSSRKRETSGLQRDLTRRKRRIRRMKRVNLRPRRRRRKKLQRRKSRRTRSSLRLRRRRQEDRLLRLKDRRRKKGECWKNENETLIRTRSCQGLEAGCLSLTWIRIRRNLSIILGFCRFSLRM